MERVFQDLEKKKVNIVHIKWYKYHMKKEKNQYHHGHLAESLLGAVDGIASQFGLEAVTLRGCAKRVGVSPAAAFRHYTDKRALLTAFATRALNQLADAMETAKTASNEKGEDEFLAVGMAYIGFALNKPAFFRAMWREETIYTLDESYLAATERLASYLKGGFVKTIADDDPGNFSSQELLAWSSVHGLANLFVDGPVGNDMKPEDKLLLANEVLNQLVPAFSPAIDS
ncbi:MAG: TetR/AcrR family transcriptional regulator [Gammaproteobacteria bacterium]|nr:TetR/AcrR family transcriptional regulator [Gammaproteobacteria bacterium]